MYLTKAEEAILNGELGPAKQLAAKLLVALGDRLGAEKLAPIESAHISGVSYKTMRDSGLQFLEYFSNLEGAKVCVPSTLNPAGMDTQEWEKMGIPKEFAEQQRKIIKLYSRMGVNVTCSCTPYLDGNVPRKGEIVAWGESSATIYANSVIGARTNRESATSSLLSAILGKTPYYGLHLYENRIGQLLIEVQCEITNSSDYGALGYLIGKIAGLKIPVIVGVNPRGLENKKSLGAAMAASGGVALFYTKENRYNTDYNSPNRMDKVIIDRKELYEAYEKLSTCNNTDEGLAVIGCPHCSLNELKQIQKELRWKKIRPDYKLWVFTSKTVYRKAKKLNIIPQIEKSGCEVYKDTCMIVSPIEKMGYKHILTNSAKAATYAPSFCKVNVTYMTKKDILKEITI